MFCINCGARLGDTETQCPLCNTVVYHPQLKQVPAEPLYPKNKIPQTKTRSKGLNAVILILFFIPLLTSLLSDLQGDGNLSWFGTVAGALLLGYIAFFLPLWFHRPNPVIFAPCTFAAAIVYLLYLNLRSGGSWFFSFAFPVAGGFGLIVCAVITLLHYVGKGKLYIFGGAFIALGALILLIELLLGVSFQVAFVGWSLYPFVVLVLLGGMLIYVAIDRSAREMLERKLFF